MTRNRQGKPNESDLNIFNNFFSKILRKNENILKSEKSILIEWDENMLVENILNFILYLIFVGQLNNGFPKI